MINRRKFLKIAGFSSLAFAMPSLAGSIKPHIVIIGGGFSGATCAKYLKIWGGDSIDVTIIEKNSSYVSPILSNLVLNGQKSLSDLTFDYVSLNQKYKINFIHKNVSSIDKINNKIILDDNVEINYTKVVLATGIDFTYPNTYDISKVTHAWIAGNQTSILKNQINSLKSGDSFVMNIPKTPYRCPPGPYERACVVADYLKNTKKIDVNITVLDANSDFVVEKETFGTKFNSYGINYQTNCDITNINDNTNTITYTQNVISKTISADVINFIPNQTASKLVLDTNLVDNTNFAPVNLLSYESTISNNIYIIGDSHKSIQPKAGHIGNNEGKICADAILRTLNNIALFQAPKTSSACYSPVNKTQASWLSAVYKYENNQMVLAYKSSNAPSNTNYYNMFNWSGNLFNDTFG